MSRKIVYNRNLSQDHQVLIDEVPQNSSLSYCRFSDFPRDGNKIINSKRLVSIAILIVLFLSGYFTYYLVSHILESQKRLSEYENKNLQDTNTLIINHSNETILNPTMRQTTEYYRTFISSTTESNYHNNASETTPNIITEGAVTSTITTRRTTTVAPVSTTVTVTDERQSELKKCLNDITNQFKGIPVDSCVKNPIAIKSIVEFIASDMELFDCLINRPYNCDKEFHDHFKHDKFVLGMKHIRYNFFIGADGYLYEGRPLSCNFDDIRHVKWGSLGYNDSVIIIGMPSCHKLKSENYDWKLSLNFVFENWLDCFKQAGALSETYSMLFDKNCEHYLSDAFVLNYEKHIHFINRNMEEDKKDDYNVDNPYSNPIETTSVTRVSTTTETVTKERRHELEESIKDRTNRFEEISTAREDNYCVNHTIGMKSIVEFIGSDDELFDCLNLENENCDKKFHSHVENDKKVGMKHIRYNFVMGGHGDLYEGRPLSCNFEDIRRVGYGFNDSVIVIGMPLCHKLNFENYRDINHFNHGVETLLYSFKEEGLLSDSYIMQFDESCKHYLNHQLITRYEGRIKFVSRPTKNDEYEFVRESDYTDYNNYEYK